MGKTFDINFDFGNAVNDLANINKSAVELQKNLKETSFVVNLDLNKALQKTDEELARIEQRSFDDVLSGPAGILSKMIGDIPVLGRFLAPLFRNPVDNLNRMNKSMMVFNDSMRRLGGLDGFKKKVGELFKSFSSNTNLFTTNLIGSMKGAFGLIKGGGAAAFKAIIPSITAIGAALGPILAVIAGIVAAVFTMKQIWKFNIGGIQTEVYALVGLIRDQLGTSLVAFQKLLQKLSPVFKLVFQPFFHALKGIVTILGAVLKGVMTILDPIISVIGEIAAPFAELQGEAMGSINIFKILGDVIGVVAKIIAFALKVALTPLRLLAKGIAWLVELGKKLGGAFMKLPWVQKMFSAIGQGVKELQAFLVGLLEPFQKLIDGAKKIGNFLGITGGEEDKLPESVSPQGRSVGTNVSNNSSRTTVVQPNITVNTSREVTAQGGRDFANSLSGTLATQARSS